MEPVIIRGIREVSGELLQLIIQDKIQFFSGEGETDSRGENEEAEQERNGKQCIQQY